MSELKIFDWSDAAKEPFFCEAERIVAESGLADKTGVDRSSFAITYSGQAKVYLKPVSIKEDRKEKLWKKIVQMPGFVEDKTRKKGKAGVGVEKPLFYVGYIPFALADFGYQYKK